MTTHTRSSGSVARHKRGKPTTIRTPRRAKLTLFRCAGGRRTVRAPKKSGVEILSDSCRLFLLLGLGDNSAGNPRRRSAVGRTAHRVNYERCPTVAEDRMIVAAERYVRRHHRNMCGSLRADYQFEIRDIARGSAAMIVSARGSRKVRSGRLEIGPLA